MLFIGVGQAFAVSAGCAALVGGFDSANGGPFGTSSGTGFDAGDQIIVTFSHGNSGSFYQIHDVAQGVNPIFFSSHTYIVPLATSQAISISVNNTGNFLVSWTCSPGTPPAVTSTSVVASPNPAAVGQSLTFTATVSNATANATGIVFFKLDGVNLGFAPLLGTTATFPEGGIGAGNHTLEADYNGDTNNLASSGSTILVVPKTSQTITYTSTAPGAATAGGATYTPTATASSGLSVDFTIDASSAAVCSISGGVVSFQGAGTCIINANQAGDANYDAAPQVQQSFTVGKGSQTITFTSSAPAGAAIGATYTPAATATSGLAVTFTIDASSTAICSISSGVVSFQALGTCTINANQGGNSNYNAAPQVQQSVIVSKTPQTITITSSAPSAAAVGGATYTPTATATSGLAVTFTIDAVSSSVCSISGGVVSFQAVGTCTINANQAGNSSFTAAPQVQQSFGVGKGAQTISFTSSAPAAAAVGGATYTPAAAATSGLAFTFAIDAASASVCSISGGVVSFQGAGTCIIDANQGGNSNFNAAPQVQQSFNVGKGVQTISFTSTAPSGVVAGGATYTPAATATSGLAVTFTIDSSSAAVCSISGGVVSFQAAGTCTIDANQAGNANFNAAPQVQQSFAVGKAATSVALTTSSTAVFFGVPVTLTATVTGVSPTGTVTFFDGATSIGTVALSGTSASLTTKTLSSGPHSLTARYGGDANNSPSTSAAKSVTVNARPDPSLDPDVIGIVGAQVNAVVRFVDTQIDNISGRLDQLHNDDSGNNAFAFGLSFNQPDVVPNSALAYQQQDTRKPSSLANGAGPFAGLAANAAEPTPSAKRAALPFQLWISGALNFGATDRFGGVTNKFTTSGVTMGIDGRLLEAFKAGMAFGFAKDGTIVGNNGSRSDATNMSVSLYGDYRLMPHTFIDVIGGYGRGVIGTRRFASTGNVFVDGTRNVNEWYGAVMLTREHRDGPFRLAPYLRLDAGHLIFDPYTESGSPIWALSYQKMTTDSVSGVIGLRTSYDIPMSWGLLTLRDRLEYRRRFAGEYNQLLGYADIAGGTVYSIAGTGLSNDSWTASLGAQAKSGNVTFNVEYLLSASNAQNWEQGAHFSLSLHY